jgi:CHAD domain-containing protein
VQAETLALAALVRMADGLDYSQTGTSQLGEIRGPETPLPPSEEGGGGRVEIEVTGPYAAIDADRAQHKADLWRLLFETDVQFKAVPDALTLEWRAGSEVLSLPDEPGLEADDSMAEAARKTLFFHFQRMRYHEPGTRLGEDIEELHDMRVATRRMRAALRVFGAYLDTDEMSPFVKGLRRTGRTLGAVRDLDVFWEKTQHYLDTLPPAQQGALDPLREVWEAERERARDRMLVYLDSDRYSRFRERWGEFLQRPGAGALAVISQAGEPLPNRLRHVVPVAVYQRLAAVRAYDEWVTGPDVSLERLHQLRIAAKGLRYTLEYFREVLGPETKAVIDEVKGLQDHLGDLQDAVVASNLLRDFLTWGTWGHTQIEGRKVILPTEPVVAPGVAAYLTARQVELQNLLDTFPQAWARVQSVEFGQMVAASLAVL